MKSLAEYIGDVKVKLGNPRMSDREAGEWLGQAIGSGPFSQSYVAGAKNKKCTDPLAIAIATVLELEPGELIWVARLEREKTPEVRAHLESWTVVLKKALALAPSITAKSVIALAVALGSIFSPSHDAMALGGAGRFRRASC